MNNARNLEPEDRLKPAQVDVGMGDWVHSCALLLEGMVLVVDIHVVATDNVGADNQDKAEHQEEKYSAVVCPPRQNEMEEIRAIGKDERNKENERKIPDRFRARDFPYPQKCQTVVVSDSKRKEEEKKKGARVTEDAQEIDSPPPLEPRFARGRGRFRLSGLGLRGVGHEEGYGGAGAGTRWKR